MTTWQRHGHGAGWKLLPDGRIVLEGGLRHISIGARRNYRLDDEGAIRTKGHPTTAQTLCNEYGGRISDAAEAFDLPAAWIAAMVTIEARRIPGTLSFDPISIRDEDIGKSVETPLHKYRDRPNRISAGLMQTLISTARHMASEYGTPFEVSGVGGVIDICDLCIPERSLWLGAAYMRYQSDRYGEDPILLVGSYNAGGVYETSKNPWNLRTYGRDRVAKFAAYHNDILEVSRG